MSAWLENWDVLGPPRNGYATPYRLYFDDAEWMRRTFELATVNRLNVLLCRKTAISDRLFMHSAKGGANFSELIPFRRLPFRSTKWTAGARREGQEKSEVVCGRRAEIVFDALLHQARRPRLLDIAQPTIQAFGATIG